MWELDADRRASAGSTPTTRAHNTFSWLRFGTGDRATDAPVVACVMNFSGETQQSYRVGLPRAGRWTVVLDTAGYHPDAPSSAGLVVEARGGELARPAVRRRRHRAAPLDRLARPVDEPDA